MSALRSLLEPRWVAVTSSREALSWESLIEIFPASQRADISFDRLKEEWIYVCSLLGLEWRRCRPDDDVAELFQRPLLGTLGGPLDDLEFELNRTLKPRTGEKHFPSKLGELAALLARERRVD